MDNKTSKGAQLHGAAAASHEKAEQNKGASSKDQAKSNASGSAKPSSNAASKTNANKSR